MAWPRNPLRPGPRVGPTGKQTSLHGDMQFVTENRTYWLVSSQALGAATSCCFCCCAAATACGRRLLLRCRPLHTWLPYQDTGAQGQTATANGPQPDPCHTCLMPHGAKWCTPVQPALEPQLPVSTLLFFLFCPFFWGFWFYAVSPCLTQMQPFHALTAPYPAASWSPARSGTTEQQQGPWRSHEARQSLAGWQ